MYAQLAWRNIWRNPRRTFIILTAIFIGVASMVFFGAFMRGMMASMVQNAIDNLTGHVAIQHEAYRQDPAIENRIDNVQNILASVQPLLPPQARVTVRIRLDAVVNNAREIAGVTMVGVEPEAEKHCSFIGTAPLEGEFISADDGNGMLIGQALMEKLGTAVGKKLVLVSLDDGHAVIELVDDGELTWDAAFQGTAGGRVTEDELLHNLLQPEDALSGWIDSVQFIQNGRQIYADHVLGLSHPVTREELQEAAGSRMVPD